MSGLLARLRGLAGSVRVRTTVAALVVVGAASIIGAAAVVVLLQRSLIADVRSSALLHAEAVARTFAAGDRGASIEIGDEEEEFVQVLNRRGQVVAASRNLAGRGAIARLQPGETRRLDELPFEDDPFLAVARAASTPAGPVTVVAGRTMETVVEASRTVVALLASAAPLLLLLVGVVVWRLVGRALSPVEAIRAEAEAISTEELHRRVPDPPGADEIARLATTMNDMLARLERGQARQRRFVSDASHELRSPVATIRQHAEVALAHPGSTGVTELAGVVLQEGLRLQALVEDLLVLTRIDEGTLQVASRPVDLDDLLFGEAKRLRSTTKLGIDTAGVSAGRVMGDRAHLEKAVRNLADNAARHARKRVVMSLQRTAGEVMLTVEDDGDGIPVADRERVFERFVRLDGARARDSGGSGLGLAIVAEIVRAHDGAVAVREASSGGARVEVRLPSSE